MKSVITIISPYVSPVLVNYKITIFTIFPQFPSVKSHFCAGSNHRGEAHEEVAIALIVRCGGHATQAPQDPILEAMDVFPHQTMA